MRLYLKRILEPRCGEVHQLELERYCADRHSFWGRDEVQTAAITIVFVLVGLFSTSGGSR